MIRDITLGQFYPGNSVIHRLDPRVKILATLLYIVALFVVKDFTGFIAAFYLCAFHHIFALRHLVAAWGALVVDGHLRSERQRHSFQQVGTTRTVQTRTQFVVALRLQLVGESVAVDVLKRVEQTAHAL